MIALAAPVFFASVLGSLHCVGMCGGFVVMLFGPAGLAGPAGPTLSAAAAAGRSSR